MNNIFIFIDRRYCIILTKEHCYAKHNLQSILLILSVECLIIKLQESKVIKGIGIGSIELQILSYADDSILTVADDASLQNSLKANQDVTEVSGLIIFF